jgi:hypothetical protein
MHDPIQPNSKVGDKMAEHLQVIHKLNIENIVGKHDTLNFCIDYDGNLILLTSTKDRGKYLHSIFQVTEWGVKIVVVPPSKKEFHYAQPLGENWLLVNARVNDKKAYNAFVYNESQYLISSFHLGDGIEDVQTTKNAEIWVSYFDEGIYGGTIGGSGLLCFDTNGVLIFDFIKFVQIPSNNEIPFIDDCYSLNVCSNETVYLYYYSDFPLLALHNKTGYEIFNHKAFEKSPIAGSHAFSIWDDQILFGHGYNGKGKLHLYSLNKKSTKSFLPVNEQNKLIKYDYAVGRKHKMFLVCENDVYLVDIRDVI